MLDSVIYILIYIYIQNEYYTDLMFIGCSFEGSTFKCWQLSILMTGLLTIILADWTARKYTKHFNGKPSFHLIYCQDLAIRNQHGSSHYTLVFFENRGSTQKHKFQNYVFQVIIVFFPKGCNWLQNTTKMVLLFSLCWHPNLTTVLITFCAMIPPLFISGGNITSQSCWVLDVFTQT